MLQSPAASARRAHLPLPPSPHRPRAPEQAQCGPGRGVGARWAWPSEAALSPSEPVGVARRAAGRGVAGGRGQRAGGRGAGGGGGGLAGDRVGFERSCRRCRRHREGAGHGRHHAGAGRGEIRAAGGAAGPERALPGSGLLLQGTAGTRRFPRGAGVSFLSMPRAAWRSRAAGGFALPPRCPQGRTGVLAAPRPGPALPAERGALGQPGRPRPPPAAVPGTSCSGRGGRGGARRDGSGGRAWASKVCQAPEEPRPPGRLAKRLFPACCFQGGTSAARALMFTHSVRGSTAGTLLGKRERALLPAAGDTAPSVLLGRFTVT